MSERKHSPMKYPICPECGKNTIVIFSPPKEPTDFSKLGSNEYIDWERVHIYCCNAETNCQINTPIKKLCTPPDEARYSLTDSLRSENKALKEKLESCNWSCRVEMQRNDKLKSDNKMLVEVCKKVLNDKEMQPVGMVEMLEKAISQAEKSVEGSRKDNGGE